jgi:integrase/recombinase XerD
MFHCCADDLSIQWSLDGTALLAHRLKLRPQDHRDAIRALLACFVDTKTKFDTFCKMAERLLRWSTSELRRTLSSLTLEDLLITDDF